MAITSKNQFVENFRRRTKKFSLDAVDIYRKLPKTDEGYIIGKQFLRSALSVGANYRAVCNARSRNEFYSKLCITLEEADETVFWSEIIEETNLIVSNEIKSFCKEAKEIVNVLSAARKNT